MEENGNQSLCTSWNVLITEACSGTLVDLKEHDEEYAAAIIKQNEAVRILNEMAVQFKEEAQRKKFEEQVEALLYEVGTRELQACYLAGAADGLRLANKLGILDL